MLCECCDSIGPRLAGRGSFQKKSWLSAVSASRGTFFYKKLFNICCPRDCVSRTANGEKLFIKKFLVPLLVRPSKQMSPKRIEITIGDPTRKFPRKESRAIARPMQISRFHVYCIHCPLISGCYRYSAY